jgi:ABC-type nitrate/sulfonate/bicarbonate transport system permease component
MSSPLGKHHRIVYKKKWHIFATLFVIVVPVVFLVLFSKIAHITTQTLFFNIGASLIRLLIAFVISVSLGWALAVAFYKGKVSVIALPVFDVLQSIPSFAALPFAVMYWGKSTGTVVFFLVLAMIWPIIFSIISSLKLIKSDYEEAATIYGLKGWKRIRYFLFPASVPGLITGTIIGLGEAWEAIIATEMIVGMPSGLGSFFQRFSQDPRITGFGILGLLLIIFSINKLFLLPLLERSHSLMDE